MSAREASTSVADLARAAMAYMTHAADCSIISGASGGEGRVLCDCGMLKTREDLHEALEVLREG